MSPFREIVTNISKHSLFDKEIHKLFFRNDEKNTLCLSTTTLIKKHLSGEYFDYLKNRIDMDYYANIGTKIHETIENALLEKDYEKEHESNVNDALQLIRLYKLIDYAIELPICGKNLIGGVMDLVGIDKNGIWYVFDWKTSSRPLITHEIQNSIYRILLKEYLPNDTIIIGICLYTDRKQSKKATHKIYTKIHPMAIKLIKIHEWKMNEYGSDYWYLL